MDRTRPGPFFERPTILLVVETRVQDEERGVVLHRIVRLEKGHVDPESYRAFEQQTKHSWEEDPEMHRIA